MDNLELDLKEQEKVIVKGKSNNKNIKKINNDKKNTADDIDDIADGLKDMDINKDIIYVGDITKKKIANEKRIESCKIVGSEKKKEGHQREKNFLNKYNPQDANKPTEYGATSDTNICPKHDICNKLNEIIKPSNLNVSNKSGKSIQLTLGNIPELHNINVDILKNKEYVRNFLNKYLKKSESSKPAGILVYDDKTKYIFFNTDDIVNYIVDNCKWRKLESGRIKGDFADGDNSKQYITYEHRKRGINAKISYFLGFSGGKGIEFINLLKKNIKYVEDSYI